MNFLDESFSPASENYSLGGNLDSCTLILMDICAYYDTSWEMVQRIYLKSFNVEFSNVLEKASPDSPWWLGILKVAIKMLREGYNKFAKELIRTDDTFRSSEAEMQSQVKLIPPPWQLPLSCAYFCVKFLFCCYNCFIKKYHCNSDKVLLSSIASRALAGYYKRYLACLASQLLSPSVMV